MHKSQMIGFKMVKNWWSDYNW